jgi:hypothetical protein
VAVKKKHFGAVMMMMMMMMMMKNFVEKLCFGIEKRVFEDFLVVFVAGGWAGGAQCGSFWHGPRGRLFDFSVCLDHSYSL